MVAVFTTPDAAINDLPPLLIRHAQSARKSASDRDSSSDTSNNSSASLSSYTDPACQEQPVQASPAPEALEFLDPTALDPGTIPLSASFLHAPASQLQPRTTLAVVVGAGFNDHFDEIRKTCGCEGGKVTWFRTDVEKSKRLGLHGRSKSEDLGRRIETGLKVWVAEPETAKGEGEVVRYF